MEVPADLNLDVSTQSQKFSVSSWDGPLGPKHSTPIRGSCNEDLAKLLPFDQSSINSDDDTISLQLPSYVSDSFLRRVIQKIPNVGDNSKLMENFITQIGRTRMGRLRNESLAEENRTILSRSNAVRNLDDLGQQENRENLARSSVKYFSDENIAANISSATDNISRLRPKSIASTTDGMGRYPIVSTSRIINFGFISLSDCSAIRHKILNTSNDILHIKLTIESNASNQDFGPDDEGTFEIDGPTQQIMKPREECLIVVKFTPRKAKKSIARLFIERVSGEPAKFIVRLIGYGGKADVQLAENNFNDGLLLPFTTSYGYLLTPVSHSFNRYFLNFENKGHRSGFVRIVVEDRNGSNVSSDEIFVTPTRFVLDYNESGNKTQRVVIRVKKGFERKKVTDVDESGIVQQSVDSHFVDVDNDICYTLVVYCGEEFSRRRLRNWEASHGPSFIMNGIKFTDTFENEDKFDESIVSKLLPRCNPGGDFKEGLRCMRLYVTDNRSITYLGITPLENKTGHHRKLVPDQSVAMRSICPNESTLAMASPMSRYKRV